MTTLVEYDYLWEFPKQIPKKKGKVKTEKIRTNIISIGFQISLRTKCLHQSQEKKKTVTRSSPQDRWEKRKCEQMLPITCMFVTVELL